jgi:hypothetical protein
VSVELFRDDDQGYLTWLSANAQGYVLNIQQTLTPSDARAHHARCSTITGGAATRQEMDRPVREGMFLVAAGARRLGARAPATREFCELLRTPERRV